MKDLYSRLVLAYATLLSVLLTGLGIVLGQFFALFGEEHADLQWKYWTFLVVVLFAAFILSLLMAAKMMRQYAGPVDQITKTAKQIARGDYLARTSIEDVTMGGTPHDELVVAIHQIARNLQEMSMSRTMEKERLNTLIESMGSGLLMFGREGAVNLSNRAFEQTFGFRKDELVGKTFKSLRLPYDIESLIEDVFMTEQVQEKQVRIEVEGKISHMSVYGAPVIGVHGNWLGIIVVMHNITELVRLEEVRKDFVANVSHELRTPVTSIKGFTETLLDGAMMDPVVMKEFLTIIQKESDRLNLLIHDLLELSGVEREGFSLNMRSVRLKDIIDDAYKAVSPNLARKEMSLHIEVPSDLIMEADADRLVQVMVNLLTNAINYSKESTTIRVQGTDLQDEVLIEVKDEGIGIPSTELPRLFERFYRVDRARSRDSGGTGLGLAIVKHLVEVHEGTVDVTSEVGKGTTFQVRMPKHHM
ncbi:regulon sensor histidine kinase protein phor [Bacillus sp. OxB-1]|uniref:two-component system histidine kinase PnpS n=1 Tax=Bacillus sp. (strain OxB-1) TaxID=98228 RepID=UPI0005823252|nr:ATP-binding protein [Bacillus sp. OxB-1]BAQ11732.1 regulon sensor histidine kinase protein phor [Bacillus sp. OxB-1]